MNAYVKQLVGVRPIQSYYKLNEFKEDYNIHYSYPRDLEEEISKEI